MLLLSIAMKNEEVYLYKKLRRTPSLGDEPAPQIVTSVYLESVVNKHQGSQGNQCGEKFCGDKCSASHNLPRIP